MTTIKSSEGTAIASLIHAYSVVLLIGGQYSLLLRSKELDCLTTVPLILQAPDSTTTTMILLLVKRHRCKLSVFCAKETPQISSSCHLSCAGQSG